MPAIVPVTEYNKAAWDALYHSSGEESVWGAAPIPFVSEFVEKITSNLPVTCRVLDAATGEGRHLPVLLTHSDKVHACDSSQHALAKVSLMKGDIATHLCDLSQTGYDSNTFDLITLIDTVETLPNAPEVLREMLRILKPGGSLLCNIPGPDDEVSSSENMEPTMSHDDQSMRYQGSYYFRFYEDADALELVRAAGFKVVEQVTRSWVEQAHPGFRDYEHDHTSRVYWLQKP